MSAQSRPFLVEGAASEMFKFCGLRAASQPAEPPPCSEILVSLAAARRHRSGTSAEWLHGNGFMWVKSVTGWIQRAVASLGPSRLVRDRLDTEGCGLSRSDSASPWSTGYRGLWLVSVVSASPWSTGYRGLWLVSVRLG
ncbi:hypothetical protein RRG08_020175 [Elysia crispata]|uniref:Uncharacterized protein n=1 Tax=Elysia crispata TaxID=231223 RepID=A0AAE0YPA0_9GAST|nr:hypothetical protein RRG08_020175 [Elysia crispata]